MRKRLPGAPLRVINFDWHGMVKDLREKGAVEGLWALLETIIAQVRLCTYLINHNSCAGSFVSFVYMHMWVGLRVPLCMQSDISVGTLEPSGTAAQEESESEERARSGADASTSGATPWGDEWKVRTANCFSMSWLLYCFCV